MSTSVGFQNFDKVMTFLKRFSLHEDVDNGIIRIGVVGYSTASKVEFHLNEYSTSATLNVGIDNITYMLGNTNTAAGLRMMRNMFAPEHGDRSDADNVAIIITDGVSNIDSRRTVPEAEAAKFAGIKIYAIGVGLFETTELKGIASVPLEEHLFLAEDFSELGVLTDTIFDSSCPQTTPKPRPTTPKPTTPQPATLVPPSPIGSITFMHLILNLKRLTTSLCSHTTTRIFFWTGNILRTIHIVYMVVYEEENAFTFKYTLHN